MFQGWLTAAVFLPIAAAVAIALLGRNATRVKVFAAIVSVVEFVLAFVIFTAYDTSDGADRYQLIDRAAGWIPVESLRVEYFLAIDGLRRSPGAADGSAWDGRGVRVVEHQRPRA